MYISVVWLLQAVPEAAGAGVGGPSRLFARTTCDLHRIV